MSLAAVRFPIRFSRFNALLMGALGMSPKRSFVEVTDEDVRVQMGWAFRATVPRRSIVGARRRGYVWWAYGVHGGGGRWIVNGSGHQMVVLVIDPRVRARILGFRVRVKEVWVSLEDPDGFLAAIGH